MNRYNVAALLAGAATIVIAVLVGIVGEPYNRGISRAVVLMTTIPMGVLFFPFLVDVVRGSEAKHRALDSADLFGAGVSLIGWGVSMQYTRAVFFSQSCGIETNCYGLISAIQVLLLAGACWLLLSAFVFVATGARKNWMIGVLLASATVAIASYFVSTSL